MGCLLGRLMIRVVRYLADLALSHKRRQHAKFVVDFLKPQLRAGKTSGLDALFL